MAGGEVFTIEGRLAARASDIQRDWLWELILPIQELGLEEATSEDLIVRCRNAVIPGRTVDPIDSNFMGMKQWFPGKPMFPYTFEATFEEFEDQKVHKVLYEWLQKVIDIEPDSVTGGVSQALEKRDIAKDIFLIEYKYNQGVQMDRKIKFVNAWPTAVADTPVSYDSNASVKYSVTFQYDYWQLV